MYQGRFKAFPIQADEHFLTACRYVERNTLRAGVVPHAQDWRWGSLWVRHHGDETLRALLSAWPVECPADWGRLVNRPMTERETDAIQIGIVRNRPYGDESWQKKQAKQRGLSHTMRREGRPRTQKLASKPTN